MHIAIISDTHLPRGQRRLPEGCISRLREADVIIHAGDLVGLSVLRELEALGRVVAVHGNVDDQDVRAVLPVEATLSAAGASIGVVHDAGPSRGRLARLRARFPGAAAVIFGHSHIPLHERAEDGFQIFNPGSPTERRRAPRHTMGLGRLSAQGVSLGLVGLGRRDGRPGARCRALPPRSRDPRADTLRRVDLSLFFAGTAGSIPTAGRGLPAMLVRRGGDRILFDCGEGTQRQLVRSVGLVELRDIFITHFHADHWLGLPGLLKTFDLRARERPLTVYGPPGLRELLMLALRVAGRVHFELELVELAVGDQLERDGYRIAPVPVAHRGLAYGYALFEDERPGVFDAQAAMALGLEPGPDFGRLQRGETVGGVRPKQVLGEPRRGRKIVISGDTRPCDALRIAAHQADLLVHEATFATEEADRAAQTGHSTATQAAEVAREAKVRMLALTHFSTRYPPARLGDESRAVFADTVLPRDFDTVEIPFPERGKPQLEHWDGRTVAEPEVDADAQAALSESPI